MTVSKGAIMRSLLSIGLLLLVIVVIGFEFAMLVPQTRFIALYFISDSAKLIRSARVGMVEQDVRASLGTPHRTWFHESEVETNGFGPPHPSVPINGKLLIYQVTYVPIWGCRIYVYIGQDGKVDTVVYAST